MKLYLFVAEDGEAAQRLAREASERQLAMRLYVGDEAESVRLREVYDITTRPAVLVTLEDGSYVRLWQGALPTITEVVYAAQGR